MQLRILFFKVSICLISKPADFFFILYSIVLVYIIKGFQMFHGAFEIGYTKRFRSLDLIFFEHYFSPLTQMP